VDLSVLSRGEVGVLTVSSPSSSPSTSDQRQQPDGVAVCRHRQLRDDDGHHKTEGELADELFGEESSRGAAKGKKRRW
jgi:hypothetical protein